MKGTVAKFICTAWLVAVLTACAGQTINWDPTDYSVRSGDTLYSIAWRYEIDPDDLARWNNLRDSSLIRPGQRLKMQAPRDKYGRPIVQAESIEPDQVQSSAAKEPATPATSTDDVILVRPGDTLYGLAKKHRVNARQLAQANNLKPPYVIHPGQKLQRQAQTSVQRAAPTAKPPARTTRPATSTVAQNARVDRWQWPVRGKILSRFNSRRTDAKGIDIAGREGVAIRAAAAGRVVYSGNGLISYGNLVIIKHNNSYLSAYAHNRKLLVAEGDQVKAGQSIAELGKTGTDKPMLHFEIRKHGKPVDPLRYLPTS